MHPKVLCNNLGGANMVAAALTAEDKSWPDIMNAWYVHSNMHNTGQSVEGAFRPGSIPAQCTSAWSCPAAACAAATSAPALPHTA